MELPSEEGGFKFPSIDEAVRWAEWGFAADSMDAFARMMATRAIYLKLRGMGAVA